MRTSDDHSRLTGSEDAGPMLWFASTQHPTSIGLFSLIGANFYMAVYIVMEELEYFLKLSDQSDISAAAFDGALRLKFNPARRLNAFYQYTTRSMSAARC